MKKRILTLCILCMIFLIFASGTAYLYLSFNLSRAMDVFGSKTLTSSATPDGIHISPHGTGSHEYFLKNEGIKATVRLGNDNVSKKDGKGYVMITLEGDNKILAATERLPLNLSLVLDRSGSMAGEKLEYVKRAIREVASMLDEKDRVSLVIYDTEVETIYKSERFDKYEFLKAVDSVYDRGSTYLEGGLREGFKNLGNRNFKEYIQRVILLSDGLANVGVSDAYDLARIVRDLSEDNITVSTIGVGADYDENLMTEVAKAGRGNYYFLEHPKDAERIFAEEFKSLLNTVARNIRVDFSLEDDFEITKGVGYELKNTGYFHPHDIYSGRKLTYLFEMKNEDIKNLATGEMNLGEFKVSYDSSVSGENESVVIPINISIVADEINILADDIVYKEYMSSYIADELWKVDQNLDKVKNKKADLILDSLKKEVHDANQRLPGEFDEDISSLKEKQIYIKSIGDQDIQDSAAGRSFKKSNQYESYQKKWQK